MHVLEGHTGCPVSCVGFSVQFVLVIFRVVNFVVRSVFRVHFALVLGIVACLGVVFTSPSVTWAVLVSRFCNLVARLVLVFRIRFVVAVGLVEVFLGVVFTPLSVTCVVLVSRV